MRKKQKNNIILKIIILIILLIFLVICSFKIEEKIFVLKDNTNFDANISNSGSEIARWYFNATIVNF